MAAGRGAAAAALLAALVLAPAARADTQDTVALAGEAIGAFVGDLTEPRIDANCVELNGGLAGFAGGHESEEQELIRKLAPDKGNGLAPGAKSDAPAGLPARVYFKTATESFNRRYYFVARGGDLYFKSNAEVTHIEQPYKRLSVPRCFAGDIRGISLDDDELVAIDSTRRIYTMDGALGDPVLFNWTMRWGAPFWQGGGWHVPTGIRSWSWSVLSIPEDHTYKDGAGYDHRVGDAKVSHLWQLGADGRRLTFNDPWLPRDASYEICAPLRGRFRAVNLATSGSRLFLIGANGDMYTRLWDFDLGGYDPFFENYTYDDQRGKSNPAIQLPAPAWIHQPKIRGRITDLITIEKKDAGTVHATLRVEGRDAHGGTGFWEKDLTAAVWRFVPTGLPLKGHPIANPARDSSKRALAPSEDRRYVADTPGWTGELENFNPACSPARLVVRPRGGTPVTLWLHALDAIRQQPRARGLDGTPRHMTGAIEAPRGAASDPFVASALGGRRFTPVDVDATSGAITVRPLGWTFRYEP